MVVVMMTMMVEVERSRVGHGDVYARGVSQSMTGRIDRYSVGA